MAACVYVCVCVMCVCVAGCGSREGERQQEPGFRPDLHGLSRPLQHLFPRALENSQ